MSRAIRSLIRSLDLACAMTFGKYVHSTGGPDWEDDGHVYQWRGRLYKFVTPAKAERT